MSDTSKSFPYKKGAPNHRAIHPSETTLPVSAHEAPPLSDEEREVLDGIAKRLEAAATKLATKTAAPASFIIY